MKKIIFGLLILIMTSICFSFPIGVNAEHPCKYNPDSAICQDYCFKNPDATVCNTQIETPIYGALNTFIIIIAIIAVIMIIWSGIRMTIFHNNDTKTWAKAKNILIAAIVALFIAALALTIVNLTLGALSQTNMI